VEEFDYQLPEAAIAQVPVEPRSDARLLVALEPGTPLRHRRVADLPDLLEPGDLVVVNETRVLPARLHLRKPSGGAVEVLLLEPVDQGEWEALVRPGRRVPPGAVLLAGDAPVVQVGERLDGGRRRVRVVGRLDGHGSIPLPPYVRIPLADPERYQTVYARRPGSVAAPTAGLHLTPEVLARLRERGVGVASIDLAVGLDTFRPISVPRLDDHRMHSERFSVPDSTLEACRRARRVVAVGTTTVRALESAALTGVGEGRTSLFIRPGHRFRLVDVLLTNFHLPRSSLLVLLAAFYGQGWRELYSVALDEGYRFLSFGDAMLVGRSSWR
jgi:S-adenosylmethionine:tRNA ribosyltransferase-isomerase